MSICVIFNPTARGEKARRFRKLLEETCPDWLLKPTTGPGAARRLATESVLSGIETIVAAGGDGTLNEVVNGIADAPDGFKKSRLGVLPLGTMNVFARELKIPLSFAKMWPLLNSSQHTVIDVGCATFQSSGKTERRYFVQLAGAGFDALSVELVDWEFKKKFGVGAYVHAAVKAMGCEQAPVTISNGSESHTGAAVVIGNGKLYGGPFPIFHKSDLQDGVLDAVVFTDINWTGLPRHLWSFVAGKLFKPGGSVYLQGAVLTLSSPERACLQLDGELVGELPAQITILPRELKVVVPEQK